MNKEKKKKTYAGESDQLLATTSKCVNSRCKKKSPEHHFSKACQRKRREDHSSGTEAIRIGKRGVGVPGVTAITGVDGALLSPTKGEDPARINGMEKKEEGGVYCKEKGGALAKEGKEERYPFMQ